MTNNDSYALKTQLNQAKTHSSVRLYTSRTELSNAQHVSVLTSMILLTTTITLSRLKLAPAKILQNLWLNFEIITNYSTLLFVA